MLLGGISCYYVQLPGACLYSISGYYLPKELYLSVP